MKKNLWALAALAIGYSAALVAAHPGHDAHTDHDAAPPAGLRTWTDARGVFEMQAAFVAAHDDHVQLRKANGQLVMLKLDDLSHDDQHWVEHRLEEIKLLNQRPLVVTEVAAAPPEKGSKKKSDPAGQLAAAFEPFAKLKQVTYRSDDRFFYVESNGIPDHPLMVGITAWQQQVPLPQKYVGQNAWQIPLFPVPAAEPATAKNRFLRGAIALAVNGIPIFNPLNNRGDDALLFGELDEYGGHCGRADDYHYHIAPVHLEKQVGRGKPIAYALDGYPIYGYDEPDGAKVTQLDWLNGHKDKAGDYHYHATKTYPYLNGGFYGQVTEREGQVDPQPRAEPVRQALPPLQGAKITGFTATKPSGYLLTYDVSGRKGTVAYTLAENGSVTFKYTDINGKTTTETAQPRRGGGGGRPPRPGDNPPKGGPRPPAPGAPSPGESSASEPEMPKSNLPQLTVTSSAIKPDENYPIRFTCDGQGISPPVEWSGAPKGTKSFAVNLWHIPGPGETKSYWLIYNIPAKTTKLPENSTAIGTMGLNGKNRPGYDPMCSKGPGMKKYHITVYALSEELKLAPGSANREALLAAIKGKTLAEGTLTYQYERGTRQ